MASLPIKSEILDALQKKEKQGALQSFRDQIEEELNQAKARLSSDAKSRRRKQIHTKALGELGFRNLGHLRSGGNRGLPHARGWRRADRRHPRGQPVAHGA